MCKCEMWQLNGCLMINFFPTHASPSSSVLQECWDGLPPILDLPPVPLCMVLRVEADEEDSHKQRYTVQDFAAMGIFLGCVGGDSGRGMTRSSRVHTPEQRTLQRRGKISKQRHSTVRKHQKMGKKSRGGWERQKAVCVPCLACFFSACCR